MCYKRKSKIARNGKIGRSSTTERGGHRLEAALVRAPLVRPGAAHESGTACPAVTGVGVSAPWRGNAGGTAEGLPFVPIGGTGGFFS